MFRKLNKIHANVCLNLGVAYDQLHDVEKAFDAYQAFLGLSPASPEAARLHARFDQARKAFGNNMIIAEKALAAGELSSAREIYEKTLPMYPGSARIYKAYATVLYKQKEFEQALTYYLKTHAHDPDDAAVLINMGVIYEKLGRPIDALWAYALARHKPSDERGRVTERYEALLFQNRAKIAVYYEDVNALIRAAKYDEARRRLQHLYDLGREVSEAAALKAKVQEALDRVDEAFDPTLKAAKTFYNRGVDAQDNGRFDQALRFFGRYLQVKPTGKQADEVRDRLDAMRKMMGAVVQSLLDTDEEKP
jgi:tetratricopeptide (TPR) repeat protein